jgi:hypothetical protein
MACSTQPHPRRRARRQRRRLLTVAAATGFMVTAAIATGPGGAGAGAGASLGSSVGSSVGSFVGEAGTSAQVRSTSRTSTSRTITPRTPSGTLPDADQLKAALLNAQDLGPSFSSSTGSETGTNTHATAMTGCPALNDLMNGSSSSGQVQQDVDFNGGQAGPFIGEALMTEPAAQLSSDYARDQAALKSCKTLTMTSNGTALTFALSPIDFGSAGGSAMRMEATMQGVPIDGYLAIDHVGSAELAYFFFQVQNSSPQTAGQYFRQAVDKARGVLASPRPGGTAG